MHTAQSPLCKVRRTFIGSRDFYKMVLMIVIPIIVQNAITNFVSLLDNIMVGRIGTDQMTGVSIVNQLLFVSNLCVFGGVSGAGIFASQYHGAGQPEGVRNCFRYKFYLCLGLTIITLAVLLLAGTPLISLYLSDTSDPERVALTLKYGNDYMAMMLWGIAPFALSQAYASTLRETGETTLPMRAGIIAVFINLILNYILIYGKLGAPAMGVRGAALATVISRYAELAIIAIATHSHPERYPFIYGAYSSPKVPMNLVKQITLKGMPLLLNEALWSMGIATITQCYSQRGLDVVTALNISSTVSNLFNVVFLAMGNATAIILGQVLGAQDIPKAKDYVWKLVAYSCLCSVGTGILLSIASPLIPLIYNTEPHIRHLATKLLLVCACCMPIFSVSNSSYFILRSGGKTMITFVFDCVFTWVVNLSTAYALITFTDMNIIGVYLCVQLTDLLKCALGMTLVYKGVWINNIVE